MPSQILPDPTETVRPIPALFNYDGYEHRLVERCGRGATFSKARPHSRPHTFETVRLQYRGPEITRGTSYPARESYPRPEEWGASGWTYKTLDEARWKMAEIAD